MSDGCRRAGGALSARPERGQALAIFALALTALMALMALAVDAAYLLVEHRAAQSAADLAALAGARSLPGSPSDATSRAFSVAAANGYQASVVSVVTPYAGQASQIEVRINAPVGTYFLRVLGMPNVNVGVRAVARRVPVTGAAYAIFAGVVDCGSDGEKVLDWSGSNVAVTGAVHSNSGVLVGGSNNSVVGATTYHCVNKFQNSGSGNSFNPAPVRKVQSSSWPITYTMSDFTCTYSRSGDFDLNANGPWWVGGTPSSKQLQPGVYCATGASGTIKLSSSDVSGTVTFVAGYQVDVSGSNFNLTAHTKDILAFANGSGDAVLKLAGSGGSWMGLLYAPNGQAEISGSANMSLKGGIVASRVKLNGSSFSINANAMISSLPPLLQLIE